MTHVIMISHLSDNYLSAPDVSTMHDFYCLLCQLWRTYFDYAAQAYIKQLTMLCLILTCKHSRNWRCI